MSSRKKKQGTASHRVKLRYDALMDARAPFAGDFRRGPGTRFIRHQGTAERGCCLVNNRYQYGVEEAVQSGGETSSSCRPRQERHRGSLEGQELGAFCSRGKTEQLRDRKIRSSQGRLVSRASARPRQRGARHRALSATSPCRELGDDVIDARRRR